MSVMNTSELATMLREHHIGTVSKPVPGFFIQEIQAPHHSRRADALWLPLMTGMRGQVWGYELKVSRADLMHELADPTKADPWMRYCNQWSLVVSDEAFLRGLDIPELWGILVPSGKRMMRTVRKPATLKPDGQVDAYGTILARLHYGGEDGGARLERALRETELVRDREEGYRQQIAQLRAAEAASGRMPHMQEKVAKVLAAVERVRYSSRGEYFSEVTPEAIAEGIVNHQRVLSRAESLAGVASQLAKELGPTLRRSADRVDEHMARLDALSVSLREGPEPSPAAVAGDEAARPSAPCAGREAHGYASRCPIRAGVS
jgi:hypothetical protein